VHFTLATPLSMSSKVEGERISPCTVRFSRSGWLFEHEPGSPGPCSRASCAEHFHVTSRHRAAIMFPCGNRRDVCPSIRLP
jgi:hypothetical protein